MILDAWDLGDDLKSAVGPIGDLVNVVLWHRYLAEKSIRRFPSMSDIPPFAKIAGDGFTPEWSMEIIAEAQGDKADTLKVLG